MREGHNILLEVLYLKTMRKRNDNSLFGQTEVDRVSVPLPQDNINLSNPLFEYLSISHVATPLVLRQVIDEFLHRTMIITNNYKNPFHQAHVHE